MFVKITEALLFFGLFSGCASPASTQLVAPQAFEVRPFSSAEARHPARPERARMGTLVSLLASPPRPPAVGEYPRGGSAEELSTPAQSRPLPCGLANPMPGGVTAGYAADTGLDLAGSPRDVFAIASGKLDYAEAGHTLWNGKRDSPFAVRLALDQPIAFGDHEITHVWYAHLSEIAREVHEGSGELVHVSAGARLGRSGSANGSPHLHLGMLLDGRTDQAWGTFLLEDDVRKVMCAWGKGRRLPTSDTK